METWSGPSRSRIAPFGFSWLIKKHTKKSQENPNGAILEREGPLHISNVKLLEQSETKAKAKGKAKKK